MNPFLYITVPYSMVRHRILFKDASGVGVNILLDSINIHIPSILKFTTEHQFPFIVSLSESILPDSENDAFCNKLYLLLTLSNSFSEKQTDIPVFVKATGFDFQRLEKLKDFFIKQGEHSVNFTIVEPDEGGVLNDILYCSSRHLETLSEGQLQNYLNGNIKKIIVGQEGEAVQSTTLDIVLHQNKFAAMLSAFIAHNSVAEFYRHQTQLWQNRSILYLSFINLGKRISQDEYYGLKHWYTKEYEVLPLWYKQFGHIIKVFMGKRSFKSLFHDQKT